MKKLIYIVSILLLASFDISSQESFSVDDSFQLRESVEIFTDRDIYLVDETVNFKIFNLTSNLLRESNWSRVIYLELITPDGISIVQNKYSFDSLGSSGEFKVPKGILTGNYYIRAYTKWMRNYSQYDYAYKVVTIINPKSSEKLDEEKRPDTKNIYTQFNDTVNKYLQVGTDRSGYSRKDTVEVIFHSESNVQANVAVSVVRKNARSFNYISLSKGVEEYANKYIPETRGVSLSGQIINKTDSLPLSNELVSLTLFGNTPDNYGIITDKFGRFHFSFPSFLGEKEIFINANSKNNDNTPVILVENDFCSKPIELPFVPMSTSKELTQFYNECYLYSQISRQFQKEEIQDAEINEIDSLTFQPNFYGEPSYVLNLKDYIPLPTLEDYFHELMTAVKVRQVGKKKSISILGTAQDLKIYDPLIMVDLVAISDDSKILALSPEKIKRIEVVDKPYIKGNVVYGGIINIISELNDFADVNFNSTGMFFQYNFLSEGTTENHHDLRTVDEGIPDLRKCLYWESYTIPKLSATRGFKFLTGDVPGEYIIVVRGYTEDGDLLNSITSFKVE